MSSKKPYRIVVGIDYSTTSDLALSRAFEIAAGIPNSEIHAVHVVMMTVDSVDLASVASGLTVPEAFTRLDEYLAKRVSEWEKVSGRKLEECVPHVRLHAPSSELAQIASDLEASLLVVGTHGRRGVERFLLGSVAEKVLRLAPCSVLVVRPETEEAPVPQIEPPCPRCVETRFATQGREFWCEQHSERHGQRHTYHYESRVGQPTNFPLVVR